MSDGEKKKERERVPTSLRVTTKRFCHEAKRDATWKTLPGRRETGNAWCSIMAMNSPLREAEHYHNRMLRSSNLLRSFHQLQAASVEITPHYRRELQEHLLPSASGQPRITERNTVT